MAIQYYMRAYNTTLSQYVDWIVNDQPDSTGIYSPYPTNQLTNIVVNKVVGSKIDNFLQPDEGFTSSDGYFFHLNSFDWLHASVPTATVIPPPSNFVGIAVTRGGTTNSSGLLLPGASTNFFATLFWHEAQQRWIFAKNTNGDHVTQGAYLPVGMGSTVVDGYVAIGDTPTATNIPTTGSLRLQNNHWITARRSNQTQDGYLIQLDTVDRVQLGNAVESPFVYIPGSLRVDGYIRDGGTFPSLSGFIRNSNNTNIVTFRNLLNGADVAALSSATVETFNNNVVIGDNVNAAVVLNTAAGSGASPNGTTGVHKFQVNGTTLVEIGLGNPAVNPFIRFTSGASNPSITQTTTSSGNGQTLNIQAQTTTSSGNLGGILALAAGNGSGSGANGAIELYAGTPSTPNLKMRVFPTTAASVADNNSIIVYENVFRFDTAQSNPLIRQDFAASGTGQALTVQAQNITTGTGGDVNLTSGSGTSNALAGNVNLQTGGVNRLVIIPGATAFTGTANYYTNIQQFVANVPNPSIIQETTGSASGNTLTVRAQNAATNGGVLTLSSGTGNNDANGGNVDIQTGTLSRILIDPTGSLTATANFNINQFVINGGDDSTNVPAPTWRQADRTSTGSGAINGQMWTVQAQNSTIANSIGGDLALTAGHGLLRDGYVRIQTGGIDRILVTETQTVIVGDLFVEGTHTNINSTVVDLADRVIHVNSTAASYPVASPLPTQITGFSVDRGTIAGPDKRDYYGLFWYEPDGYWRFAANTDGYAPGTEQTLSITLPVIASAYLAQPNSATTLAAIPTVGGFRALNNTNALSSRKANGLADLPLVGTDASNHLLWGSPTDNNGTIFNISTGTDYDFQVNSVTAYKLTLATSGASVLTAAAGTTSLLYKQTNTASATGANTTLQAQNAATTGGKLILTSGTGATTATDGYTHLQTGGVDRIIIHPTFTEIRDDSAEALRITPVSAGTTELLFASTVTAASIKTAPTTLTVGANTTIQSQDSSTGTGGSLLLTSGAGSTSGTAGVVRLLTGGTDRVVVRPTYTEFRDTAEAFRITPLSAGITELLFASTVSGVSIKHATTGFTDGYDMTIQAQNAVNTGGDLNLTSGTGAVIDGYLNLQIGGVTTASLVPDKLVFNKGRRRHITSVLSTGGTYLVLTTDEYIAITTLSASFSMTLPSNPVIGDCYEVKDTTGNASPTVTVTISGNDKLVDGAPSFIFTAPYEAATFTYTGAQWSVT